MRVGPPTDIPFKRRPASQIDGRSPLVCFCERICFSELIFSPMIGFQNHASISHKSYEFHSGTIGGYPALLFLLEPHDDAVRSAALHLREAAPHGIAALALAGTAQPLDSRLRGDELVLVSDHINLTGDHPLAGSPTAWCDCGFPDMSHAYDNQLMERVEAVAEALDVPCVRGVYLACPETTEEASPFVRAAIKSGASVRGTGIVPLAVLGAALRVPVAAAVVLPGNSGTGMRDYRSREERMAVLARVLLCGVLGSLSGERSGAETRLASGLKKAV